MHLNKRPILNFLKEKWTTIAIGLGAIAIRLEAIALRLEAINFINLDIEAHLSKELILRILVVQVFEVIFSLWIWDLSFGTP